MKLFVLIILAAVQSCLGFRHHSINGSDIRLVRHGRRALSARLDEYLWRDHPAGGFFQVPYQFTQEARDLGHIGDSWQNALTESQKNTVRAALRNMEGLTRALRFVEVQGQELGPFVAIGQYIGGCWSYIGNIAREMEKTYQIINLGPGCVHSDVVMHEMMHALGFHHEHARSDRDDYVAVQYQNIIEGAEANFAKSLVTSFPLRGTHYDYRSVMHYGPKDFSRNGQDTIVPLLSGGQYAGTAVSMSEGDIVELRLLYGCAGNRTLEDFCTVACPCDNKDISPCEIDAQCQEGLRCIASWCTKPARIKRLYLELSIGLAVYSYVAALAALSLA